MSWPKGQPRPAETRAKVVAAHAMSRRERFWRRALGVTETGCVEWQGSLNRYGYGQSNYRGLSRVAHRAAYELEVGPIPEGLEIDHLCFNRRCVRLDHLEPVTHAENNRRTVERRKSMAA